MQWGDAFDALHIAPGRRVVLVGAFVPYMRELRKRGQSFGVLELDLSTLRPDELVFHIPQERAAPVSYTHLALYGVSERAVSASLGAVTSLDPETTT